MGIRATQVGGRHRSGSACVESVWGNHKGEFIMAGLLQGKVALVTGGGSGIGRATAVRLAQEGAKIMIADYVPEGAERTVKMIKEAGGTASCLAADVAFGKQVENMINKTVETYGRIDCAYNNAGI